MGALERLLYGLRALTRGLGLLLLGVGGLGGAFALDLGREQLLGPAGGAAPLLLLVPSLALGLLAALGWRQVLRGRADARALGALAWCFALVLAAAPGLSLGPGWLDLERSSTWQLLAGLGALAVGFGLGHTASRAGLRPRSQALFLLGGGLGVLLLSTRLRGLGLRLPELLTVFATASSLGLVCLALGLGRKAGGPSPARCPSPAPGGGHLGPRLLVLFVAASGLAGSLVVQSWSTWVSLAPRPPASGSLALVVCLGLAAGAALGGPLLLHTRRLGLGGLVGAAVALGLGLGWFLLCAGTAALTEPDQLSWRLAGLLRQLDLETGFSFPGSLPANLGPALHALVLGPLLVALGGLPVVLVGDPGQVLGGPSSARRQALVWTGLLGLGLLPALEPLRAEPLAALPALVGALLLLVSLEGDGSSPVVGPARGLVARCLPGLGRAISLATLASVILLGARLDALRTLRSWHAPAELVAVDAAAPSLVRIDPLTGRSERWGPAGRAPDPSAGARLLQLAEGLLQGLVLPGGPLEVLALDHGVPARGADRARAGARACLLLPRPGAESPWSLEDLRAAAAQLAPGGQLVVSLPTDLPPERFLEALATAGGALPASSAWFLDGEILLLCGTEVVRPQLEDLEASLATLAHFVAELGPGSAPPRSRLQVAGGSRPSEDEAQRLRRRARNLEQLFARTSSLPTAWSPLLAVSDGPLAGTPELRAGRHLREAYLAHAWLGHHAAAAPDSLALETWAARLDRALQAALASLPGHAETLDLAELAQAEAGVRRGFELLESGEAMGAIPFLVRATQRWPERGDLALGLATALELAGNTSAAQVVLRDLGAQRASLFQTEVGRRLTGLGLTPPR